MISLYAVGTLLVFSAGHHVACFSVVPRSQYIGNQRISSTSLWMTTASYDFPPEDLHSDEGARRRQQVSSSELRRRSSSRSVDEQDDDDDETAESTARFVSGDDLHRLRRQVLGMAGELESARRAGAASRVQELEASILAAQQVDAEFVYQVSTERSEAAEAAGLHLEAARYRETAAEARAALPQFNLEGLWVGKYGDHGFEMINVTYHGDVLVAYKVTGDRNVPAGEVSFSVDLRPASDNDKALLDPIELGSEAARHWGFKFLQRFAGRGQVAAENYEKSQWMEGQLLLVQDFFSFVWVPIRHQVFFGRPSPELTLKLLREAQRPKSLAGADLRPDSEDAKSRQHLQRCLHETELLDDEMEVSDGPFFSHNQHDYYDQPGCFE